MLKNKDQNILCRRKKHNCFYLNEWALKLHSAMTSLTQLWRQVCDCDSSRPGLHDDDQCPPRSAADNTRCCCCCCCQRQQWQSNNATWMCVSIPPDHRCIIATELSFKFGTDLIRLIALACCWPAYKLVHCTDCRVWVNFSDCLRPSSQPLQV